MEPEVQNYIEMLDDLRNRFKEAVRDMTANQLNWAPPAKDVNSPYILAYHIAGSEAMWIHQIVGQRDVSRDRDAEFQATGNSPAALNERLDSIAATSRDIIGGLTLDELAQLRTQPVRRGGDQAPVRWCIAHLTEHYAEHLGHLDLTKQLYEGR